jgi:hypothetical protein
MSKIGDLIFSLGKMKPNFLGHEDWPRGLLRSLGPGCFPVRSQCSVLHSNLASILSGLILVAYS